MLFLIPALNSPRSVFGVWLPLLMHLISQIFF